MRTEYRGLLPVISGVLNQLPRDSDVMISKVKLVVVPVNKDKVIISGSLLPSTYLPSQTFPFQWVPVLPVLWNAQYAHQVVICLKLHIGLMGVHGFPFSPFVVRQVDFLPLI